MKRISSHISARCNVCGSLAKIRTSREVTKDYREAYFQCRNEACQHEFVASISFLRTIIAPLSEIVAVANDARGEGRRNLDVSPSDMPLLDFVR